MRRKLVLALVTVAVVLGPAGPAGAGTSGGFDGMDRASPAAGDDTPPRAESFEADGPDDGFERFEAWLVDMTDRYWQQQFAGDGESYESPSYVLVSPGGDAESACSDGSAGDPADWDDDSVSPAFYCPADTTIYLSTGWLYRDVYQAYGDFAVAYVIAHEMGHHAQSQAGVQRDGAAHELMADCLAGTWANSAYHDGSLEEGDVEEAVSLAWNIGGESHGTGRQRAAAFWGGYQSGAPSDC